MNQYFVVPEPFYLPASGSDIPGQASLVFDVVLLDLHNPRDGIAVTNQMVPESCTRKSVAGDFVRYHYNGSLLDGTFFDSRCVCLVFIVLTRQKKLVVDLVINEK